MIDIDELANQIHADVFDVVKTGIPLGVFPNVFQKIAFELVNYENFNLEYTCLSEDCLRAGELRELQSGVHGSHYAVSLCYSYW